MKTEVISAFSSLIAVLLVIVGALGMLVCGVFLLSSAMRDIVGAGFGFVGGTVLVGCGTISLSLQSRERDDKGLNR